EDRLRVVEQHFAPAAWRAERALSVGRTAHVSSSAKALVAAPCAPAGLAGVTRKLDSNTRATPPGFRCAVTPAANRSATSLERHARSRSSLGVPRRKGGLKRIRSKRSPATGAKRSPWRTSTLLS